MIPKSVEEQERAAEELVKQLQAGDVPPVEDPAPAADTETPPADEQIPAEVPPSDEPKSEPDRENTLEYWKQRAQTIDGKYQAETVRALHDLAEFKMQNAELKTQIAELTARVNAVPKVEEPKKDDPRLKDVEYLKKEIPEHLGAMDYLLEEKLNAKLKEIDQKIDAKVSQTTAKIDSTSFFDKLDNKVPGWDVINKDPQFIAWLGEKERYSRKTRLELLRESVAEQDLNTTVTFFADWKERTAKPAEQKPSAKDKFAAPPKPGGTATPAGSTKEAPISRDFIKSFYADQAKGKYRNRDAEAAKIEAQINAAVAAGNVY